ncbi:MAG TPA: hypothetical protein VIV54_24350, partial [Burkholderiales bacterium]
MNAPLLFDDVARTGGSLLPWLLVAPLAATVAIAAATPMAIASATALAVAFALGARRLAFGPQRMEL